jgi:hypothetical protein
VLACAHRAKASGRQARRWRKAQPARLGCFVRALREVGRCEVLERHSSLTRHSNHRPSRLRLVRRELDEILKQRQCGAKHPLLQLQNRLGAAPRVQAESKQNRDPLPIPAHPPCAVGVRCHHEHCMVPHPVHDIVRDIGWAQLGVEAGAVRASRPNPNPPSSPGALHLLQRALITSKCAVSEPTLHIKLVWQNCGLHTTDRLDAFVGLKHVCTD